MRIEYIFTGAEPTVFTGIPYDHAGDGELRSLALNPGDVFTLELEVLIPHPDLEPTDPELRRHRDEVLRHVVPPTVVALADVEAVIAEADAVNAAQQIEEPAP